MLIHPLGFNPSITSNKKQIWFSLPQPHSPGLLPFSVCIMYTASFIQCIILCLQYCQTVLLGGKACPYSLHFWQFYSLLAYSKHSMNVSWIKMNSFRNEKILNGVKDGKRTTHTILKGLQLGLKSVTRDFLWNFCTVFQYWSILTN